MEVFVGYRVGGEEGESYENSVKNLLYDNFSKDDFNNVVILFKNHSGTKGYSKYKKRRNNQKNNLIKDFYPLITF